MQTKHIKVSDLSPIIKDLNAAFNGNLEPLHAALIKGSFYATFTDPYEREKLRPISDRVGKISTAFIREKKSLLTVEELEKLSFLINSVYVGKLKYLIVELSDTVDLLNVLKTMKGSVRLTIEEIDSFIYHIKIFIKALKKVGVTTPAEIETLPAFEWKWYNSN